jgi:hypothetical protein
MSLVYILTLDNAVVFSVDEKSSIQALDLTQPSLPIVKLKVDAAL